MRILIFCIFTLLIFTACERKYSLFSQNQDLVRTIKPSTTKNEEIFRYQIRPYDKTSSFVYKTYSKGF